jgi:hypothetical protein
MAIGTGSALNLLKFARQNDQSHVFLSGFLMGIKRSVDPLTEAFNAKILNPKLQNFSRLTTCAYKQKIKKTLMNEFLQSGLLIIVLLSG